MARELKEQVTFTQSVPRPIADLVHFVEYLELRGCVRFVASKPADATLIQLAREFLEREHGEE